MLHNELAAYLLRIFVSPLLIAFFSRQFFFRERPKFPLQLRSSPSWANFFDDTFDNANFVYSISAIQISWWKVELEVEINV